MNKILTTIALAASLLIGGTVAGVGAANATQDHGTKQQVDIPAWVLRPCATEDSTNCRWNAHTQGNGLGHSFITRTLHSGQQCWFYAQPAYAKKHDHCA